MGEYRPKITIHGIERLRDRVYKREPTGWSLKRQMWGEPLNYVLGRRSKGEYNLVIVDAYHEDILEARSLRGCKRCWGGSFYHEEEGIHHVPRPQYAPALGRKNVPNGLVRAIEREINEHFEREGIPRVNFTRKGFSLDEVRKKMK